MKRRSVSVPVAALRAFALWSLLFGIVYTVTVTGLASLLFPFQASGSLTETADGKRVCLLLGQPSRRPDRFHGRPEATHLTGYADSEGNPLYYAGPSNLSPASEIFAGLVAGRVKAQRALNPDASPAVPVHLVTGSGSGMDPHITPAAAVWQIPRIAKATGLAPDVLEALVADCTEERFLGIFGAPRVNVVRLNLLLDGRLSVE